MPEYFAEPGAAAAYLLAGGLLIYPTETFYAIGCMADNARAISKIYSLKKRSLAKPLPVLAADRRQAAAACNLAQAPPTLLDSFWPGALTVVLPARERALPAAFDGKLALRVTSSPFAATLARLCGFAITSSSANFAGQAPVAALAALSRQFLDAARAYNCGIATVSASPLGGAPSTIVEPRRHSSGQWQLRVIREGIISRQMLLAHNFQLND